MKSVEHGIWPYESEEAPTTSEMSAVHDVICGAGFWDMATNVPNQEWNQL